VVDGDGYVIAFVVFIVMISRAGRHPARRGWRPMGRALGER